VSEPSGPNPAVPNRQPTRRRRWLVLGLVAVFLIGGVLGANLLFSRRHPAPTPDSGPRQGTPDPRLAYDGPFGNIHPGVEYVNDDRRCVPCHADICVSYQRHPMGRSLSRAPADFEDGLLDSAHHNPFEKQGFHFAIERRETALWHRVSREAAGQSLASLSLPVHFILGSGTRGRSYLSEQEGYLFQTPISWFAQKQIWDLSPGFSESSFSGRPVLGSCLFCHAHRTHFHEGSVNRFDQPVFSGLAIGCERCHGPAGRHLETLRSFDVVNPKRLSSPALRDAVCEQCHLKGEARVVVRGREMDEFRPGLSFAEFCTVFVPASKAGEEGNAVSHFEQMHSSRCYQHSRDEQDHRQMGCTSCHDPHVFVDAAARTAHYRDRCLRCHETHPCGLPVAERRRQQPEDSCIACHMPRFPSADIAHTAVTDHRILRVPTGRLAKRQDLQPDSLVPFRPVPGGEAQRRRDLGIALANLVLHGEADPRSFAQAAVPLLDRATADDPEDVDAWQARGLILLRLGRPAEALASFESVLGGRPRQEICLAGAAEAALQLNRLPESKAYWLRAIEVNPRWATYRAPLAQLLVRMQSWEEALEQCRAWKRLQPWSSDAALVEVLCLLKQGKAAEARKEFARLEALRPPNLDQLRAWFTEQDR
jgi:Tfp pilus assembly protein PilF